MFPATVKSLFTEISYILASPASMLRVPPKDKSVTTIKFLFIVTVSSIFIFLLAEMSSVNTLDPTPPIIALWGIVSSA